MSGTQKTCSTAGPLCDLQFTSGQRFLSALPLPAYARSCIRPMAGYPQGGSGGRENLTRRSLDGALDAKLLLDILHAGEHILKLTSMHHLIEIEGFLQNSALQNNC